MNQPTIIMLHRLAGRVRFKLSHPLREEENTKKFLLSYDGVTDFSYNNVTRSILIKFNNLKVELNEVIIRLAVSYSKQYDMIPISLFTSIKNKETKLVYYSIGSIITTAMLRASGIIKNGEIESFLNWVTVGTTAGAILDHGYREVKEKGAFDPELVSVMYFFNSIRNGKFLTGSLITWLATFGRHILDVPYKGVTIRIKEINDEYTREDNYSINIYQGTSLCNCDGNNNINVFRDVLSKFIDNNQFKLKQSFFMKNNIILDSSQIGMCKSFSI